MKIKEMMHRIFDYGLDNKCVETRTDKRNIVNYVLVSGTEQELDKLFAMCGIGKRDYGTIGRSFISNILFEVILYER